MTMTSITHTLYGYSGTNKLHTYAIPIFISGEGKLLIFSTGDAGCRGGLIDVDSLHRDKRGALLDSLTEITQREVSDPSGFFWSHEDLDDIAKDVESPKIHTTYFLLEEERRTLAKGLQEEYMRKIMLRCINHYCRDSTEIIAERIDWVELRPLVVKAYETGVRDLTGFSLLFLLLATNNGHKIDSSQIDESLRRELSIIDARYKHRKANGLKWF